MSTTFAAYLASLGALAEKAGEASLRWLAAERLVQLDEGREAGAYLLRAAALSALREIDAAQADVREAFRVDPMVPGLAESILPVFPPGEARMAALLHRLRAGGIPGEAVLAAVRAAGHEMLVLAESAAGEVTGTIWWQGGPRPTLRLRYPGGESAVELGPVAPGGMAFAARARFRAPWPEGAAHAVPEAEGALIVPKALVSATPPSLAPSGTAPRGLLVIVPAYSDWPSLSRCLESVLPQLTGESRLVVVDDASPEEAIRAGLAQLAARDHIQVLRHHFNLGFAGAVNLGLAARLPGEDVLLLNADATLPSAALQRLSRLAHSAPDIATLTPLSNNGEDLSVPRRFLPSAEPDDTLLARLDAAASAANGDGLVEMPNGVGFCLYITAHALERVGGLSGAFERGYFEDVEFCLRAGKAGLRNLAATGVYVAHAGSRSFGGEKRAYVRRNLARLKALYPDYAATSDAFMKADPLIGPSQAMVRTFLAANPVARVLVVPPDCPRPYALAAAGEPDQAILLRPFGSGWHIEMDDVAFAGEVWTDSLDLGPVLPWLAGARVEVLYGDRLALPWREALPAGALVPLAPALPPPRPEPVARLRRYALLAPDLTAPELLQLAPLFAAHPDACFVFLDSLPPTVEGHVCRPPRIFCLGTVTADDLPEVMRRAGLEAVVVVNTRYGRLDPRRAAALAAGWPVFDLP